MWYVYYIFTKIFKDFFYSSDFSLFWCSGVYLVHENKVTNSYQADESWVNEKYPEKKLAVEPQRGTKNRVLTCLDFTNPELV